MTIKYSGRIIEASPKELPKLKKAADENRVEIVTTHANEHGVPLKPTNLKCFFDKLEAKSCEEDPAAIKAVSIN